MNKITLQHDILKSLIDLRKDLKQLDKFRPFITKLSLMHSDLYNDINKLKYKRIEEKIKNNLSQFIEIFFICCIKEKNGDENKQAWECLEKFLSKGYLRYFGIYDKLPYDKLLYIYSPLIEFRINVILNGNYQYMY